MRALFCFVVIGVAVGTAAAAKAESDYSRINREWMRHSAEQRDLDRRRLAEQSEQARQEREDRYYREREARADSERAYRQDAEAERVSRSLDSLIARSSRR